MKKFLLFIVIVLSSYTNAYATLGALRDAEGRPGGICSLTGNSFSELSHLFALYNRTVESGRQCQTSISFLGSRDETIITSEVLRFTGASVVSRQNPTTMMSETIGTTFQSFGKVNYTLDTTSVGDCPIRIAANSRIQMRNLTIRVANSMIARSGRAICTNEATPRPLYTMLNADGYVVGQNPDHTPYVTIEDTVRIIPYDDPMSGSGGNRGTILIGGFDPTNLCGDGTVGCLVNLGGRSGSGGMNPGTGGMSGSGGSNPTGPGLVCERETYSLAGGGRRLSVRVSGLLTIPSSPLTCEGRGLAAPVSIRPIDGVCKMDVPASAGSYSIVASAGGYTSCTSEWMLDSNTGTGGMAGSGSTPGGTGGMAGSGSTPGGGTGGGSVGSLDCHLDVSPTATGYRLSWSRANTSSVSLSRNGSPVMLASGAEYLDVARSEITAQQTYILTLNPAMGVAACAATTNPDMTVTLAPTPTCSFPIAGVTRNSNGSYQVTYNATLARTARFTEGAGAPSNLTPGANGSVDDSFTTPVISSRAIYSLAVEGLGSLPSNSVCSLILDPAGDGNGAETAPTCNIGPVAVSGNAYQVTYSVGSDATVTQLQKGGTRPLADAATPESLDFSHATVSNGSKNLVRSEQVTETTVYRLTARKSATGPACIAYQTLVPVSGSGENPDPDRDGICNIRVTPTPSICTYFNPPGNDGPDRVDNCPFVGNPTQDDSDFDGLGDACDPNPAVSDNPEAAYAEGSGPSCQMILGTSKTAEAVVPFLVILIGFVFFKIGFGKSYKM